MGTCSAKVESANELPASFTPTPGHLLTKREEQIIALASDGLSNKAIAWQLAITPGTVKVHLHNAFEKLGIGSRRLLFRAS